MSEPFIGEIRIFAGNFAPKDWALCNGQLLPIAQNTALFSILGTYYGGDGKTTFALPDLRARAPMQPGAGPGLTPRVLGEEGGSPSVALLQTEMPAHTHQAMGSNGSASVNTTAGNVWATTTGRPAPLIYAGAAPNVQMSPNAIGVAGGSFPHNNMQPYLAMNFIIALRGIFPPRP